MLLDSFYSIKLSGSTEPNSIKTTLNINKDHPIFNGHFPGTPVVPGVCMMQIMKELLEKEVHKSLQLSSAANIKFLSVINPIENPEVLVELKYAVGENDTYVADGSISFNNTACFKISKAIYK